MWVSHNTFRLSMHLVRWVMKQEINICTVYQKNVYEDGNFYLKCISNFSVRFPCSQYNNKQMLKFMSFRELHHDYGNKNRESGDNFNLWGLRRTDMMITAEWDRWGGTFVKQNEARDRRETHSMSAMCESLERKGEVWGKWSVVAAVTSEKTKKRFSCYQVKDWRKHLPSLRCDYLEMRYLLRVLNVLIILWNVLNGAPVNFVELNEDGSPKTSVTTSADSISEISLRIF